MSDKKPTDFQLIANGKGWTFSEIGDRWSLSERQVSRIAKNPKQRDLDALQGLPKKKSNSKRKPRPC